VELNAIQYSSTAVRVGCYIGHSPRNYFSLE